jgi:FtsH-binding integral membrane protein
VILEVKIVERRMRRMWRLILYVVEVFGGVWLFGYLKWWEKGSGIGSGIGWLWMSILILRLIMLFLAVRALR